MVNFFNKIYFPQAHGQWPVDLGGGGKAWAGVSSLWFWILTSAISLQRNSFVHVFCWAFSWKWTCFWAFEKGIRRFWIYSSHSYLSESLINLNNESTNSDHVNLFSPLKAPLPLQCIQGRLSKDGACMITLSLGKLLCRGKKVQKIGIVEFGGGNRFWLSNHDERSMQSLKRFVHPPLTSEQEMIIK